MFGKCFSVTISTISNYYFPSSVTYSYISVSLITVCPTKVEKARSHLLVQIQTGEQHFGTRMVELHRYLFDSFYSDGYTETHKLASKSDQLLLCKRC